VGYQLWNNSFNYRAAMQHILFAAAKKTLPGVRTDTPRIPLKASRKNRYLEIVGLDVRRERAMLLQQRRWMLTQFPAGRSRLK
jgi:hypothetical protein